MEGRSRDELSDTEEAQNDLDKLRDNEDTDWTRIRPFGAGLKRKRVQFVKATDASNASEQSPSTTPKKKKTSSSNISDLYLSLVMPSGGKASSTSSTFNSTSSSASESAAPPSCSGLLPPPPSSSSSLQAEAQDADETTVQSGDAENLTSQHDPSEMVVHKTNYGLYCSTCKIQITTDMKTHVRSIVHMYNEGHSDVPHHFNRNSEGFKHMVDLGWNPDERQGLGPDGLGIRYPIKVSEKNDKLGIGAKRIKNSSTASKDVQIGDKAKPMSVKDLRKLEIIEREKRRNLHEYLSR